MEQVWPDVQEITNRIYDEVNERYVTNASRRSGSGTDSASFFSAQSARSWLTAVRCWWQLLQETLPLAMLASSYACNSSYIYLPLWRAEPSNRWRMVAAKTLS